MTNATKNEPQNDPEWAEGERCADCSIDLIPAVDSFFVVREGVTLCAECSVRRGGKYDAHRDLWTLSPFVGDLHGTWELPE